MYIKNTLYAGIWAPSNNNALVFAYNGNDQSPSWTPISVAGSPFNGYPNQLIVFNNKMYVNSASSISVYDDKNQSWSSIGNSLLVPRATINTMAVFQNKLYAVGGAFGDGCREKAVAYVYNGNDSAPNWAPISVGLPKSSNICRGSIIVALRVFNNTLFAGGVDTDGVAFVYAYNGNDQMPYWTSVSKGLPGLPDSWNTEVDSLTVSNNTLYAGGVSNYGHDLFVYAYNNNKGAPSWTSVGSNGLPANISGPSISLAAFNNILYMMANGIDGKAFLYALQPSKER